MGLKYCKLNEKEQRKLLKYYVSEITARSAADRMGIQANTAALFYRKIRQIISERLEVDTFKSDKQVKLKKGIPRQIQCTKWRHHTSDKVPAFSILKHGGKVYTQIMDNPRTSTLTPGFQQSRLPHTMYMENYHSQNILGASAFRPDAANHSEFLINRHNPTSGVENFWHQAERTLRRYNGIPAKQFHLFLKECEFRFNYGSHKKQLSTLKKWCNL